MKNVVLCILFSILFISESFAQKDWFWLNPKPLGNELHSVYFYDELNGWAFGGSSVLRMREGSPNFTIVPTECIIIRTTDGGNSWQTQFSEVLSGLQASSFISPTTGWAAGGAGIILKTTDAGEEWVIQDNPLLGTNEIISEIQFVSVTTGWFTTGTKIFKTTNGGNTWDSLQHPTLKSGNQIRSVHFISETTGWIACDWGPVLKTVDGGNNWIVQQSGLSFASSIYFMNESIGWLAGETYDSGKDTVMILKTTNGGETWSKQITGIKERLLSINFKNENVGCAVGWNGIIYITNDGGNAWLDKSVDIDFSMLNADQLHSVCFVGDNTCYAVGESGRIIKSTNNGNDWTFLFGGETNQFNSSCFIDEKTGWIVGNEATILKTEDGGSNWIKQECGLVINYYTSFHAVSFTSKDKGWIAGETGVLKTTNGGETWITTTPDSITSLFTMYCINPTTVITAGFWGRIFKTTDDGATWTLRQIGDDESIWSVYFTSDSIGYITTYSGKIMKTTDAGDSWFKLNSGVKYALLSIYFVTSQTGWAVGAAGQILKTTDAGNSWIQQSSGDITWLQCVRFISESTGWAVGDIGKIFKTTDGGENWLLQSNPAHGMPTKFLTASFISSSVGWVAGEEGVILKTVDGGKAIVSLAELTRIEDPEEVIPKEFTMTQNYPNPFNPSTTISYSLPEEGRITIKIFDILGREVRTLVNDFKNTGSYSSVWDSKDNYNNEVSSGIYFYNIKFKDNSITKKMILVR